MKEKLSEEAARSEVQRLYDWYEVDLNDLGEEAADAAKIVEKQLVKGVRLGMIEFKEEDGFQIVQHRKNGGDPLVYGELTGQAKMESNKKKDTDRNGQMYALLGSLSGLGEMAISTLKGPDLKRAEFIATMLLFC